MFGLIDEEAVISWQLLSWCVVDDLFAAGRKGRCDEFGRDLGEMLRVYETIPYWTSYFTWAMCTTEITSVDMKTLPLEYQSALLVLYLD